MAAVINKAFNEGDYDTAWEEYSDGLMIHSTNSTLWYNRSIVVYLKGFPELAIMDAIRSLKLSEKEMDNSNTCDDKFELLTIKIFIIKCLGLIGKSIGDVGNYEKGIEIYEKAIKMFDESIGEKIVNTDFDNSNLTILANEINLGYFHEQKKNYQKELDNQIERIKKNYPTLNENFIKSFMNYVSFKFNGSYPCGESNDLTSDLNKNLQCHHYIANELRENDYITLSSINYCGDLENFEISENLTDSIGKDCIESESNYRKYQRLTIVAKKSIPKGTIILKEIAFVSVHESNSLKCDYCHVPLNHYSKFPCKNSLCSDIFCTKDCNDLALQQDHSLLCGNNLYYSFKKKVYHLLQIGAINNLVYFEILLMVKLFSIAKIRNVNPMEVQEIRYLSRFNQSISFSSNTDIDNNKVDRRKIEFPEKIFELYQDILELLQISIYNLQYDFWIFLRIWCIIKSNIFQLNPNFRNEVVGIFTISGFLAHSCTNTNVKVRNFGFGLNETKLGYGIIVEATKDIVKDQKLLISYCNMSKVPKDKRKTYLLELFGFECRCFDCQQY